MAPAAREHGHRTTYQYGCRCTPCRAANASYEAEYRLRKARHEPILGATINASETWRQLRLLTTEYETEAALSRRLGLRSGRLRYGQRVTVRTARRVQRLYTYDILAGLVPEQLRA